jgi:predicted secreted protein
MAMAAATMAPAQAQDRSVKSFNRGYRRRSISTSTHGSIRAADDHAGHGNARFNTVRTSKADDPRKTQNILAVNGAGAEQ